jgi:hypothetical protein
MVDGHGEDKTSVESGLILRDFCYLIAMVDGRGEDKTSVESGLILRHFCYFIAIVVSCYLIVACRILIVVPGYRICCLVMVSYGGVAYCIGYCIGCVGMVGDRFSLSLSCVAKGENLVRTWLDFA